MAHLRHRNDWREAPLVDPAKVVRGGIQRDRGSNGSLCEARLRTRLQVALPLPPPLLLPGSLLFSFYGTF